ncbi:glycosyltransferase family 4 protein [Desulforudis sp. 1088]|uniref:glycosyltransferase family 4 protein n=2 Tax=Candidatus Desulforudis TaxID=471826 RepID=UPI003CE51FD8
MRNHVLALAECASRSGFRVYAACPTEEMAHKLERAGAAVFTIPLAGELSPVADWRCVGMLSTFIRQYGVNLVHAHGSKAALVGRMAARLTKTRCVFTVHNSIFYEHWPTWKNRLFARIERWLAGYTDSIITVSDALKRELAEVQGVPAGKVTVIHNGIRLSFFKPDREARQRVRSELGIADEETVIGTVARFAVQKGLKYLIQAAAMLNAEGFTRTRLVIVGDGPLRPELEEEASRCGVEAIMPGYRNDIPAVLSAFDLFALPSITEGLPLIVLEAMATGLPVVATSVGGVPEAVAHGTTGLLVPPGDAGALAGGLAMLLQHPETAGRFGTAGRERAAREFSEEQMLTRTISVYNELLSAQRSW